MSIKIKALSKIEKFEIGKRVTTEQRYRVMLFATISFSLNLLYAFYHGILGVVNCSLWFITMCAYYIILGTMRFSAVMCSRKNAPAYSVGTEYFVMKLSGILLIVLCFVLTGVIYISLSQNIAAKHDMITMITIATYTFSKITIAIIKAVKQHKNPSPILAVIRTIGYAEVAASVLTLQRSMLVSFGSAGDQDTLRMNACTGAAVCIFIMVLGIAMMVKGNRKDCKTMAKSKLVKANNKIEETVVGTYQKIENTVVGCYGKIEDAFVDRYLTKDGETVEEAKKRINRED